MDEEIPCRFHADVLLAHPGSRPRLRHPLVANDGSAADGSLHRGLPGHVRDLRALLLLGPPGASALHGIHWLALDLPPLSGSVRASGEEWAEIALA